jgi:hypothetical protein
MRPCSLRYGLRLSRIRCLNVIGYLPEEIMWPSKSKTQENLHAFYNAGFCSQCNIMYISYNILLYLPCRDQTWTMLPSEVCSRELPYLAIISAARMASILEAVRKKQLGVSLCRKWRVLIGIRFVLSGNFGLHWESYFLNHFLGMLSRKKGFSNFWTNLLILTINSNS